MAALSTSGGNDKTYTPDDLALAIVHHYQPTGTILEPFAGKGAFVRAYHAYNASAGLLAARPLTEIHHFDLEPEDGTAPRDFLTYDGPRVDWIITNPPWSRFYDCLVKAMKVARNVVFLDKLNAWGFTGRLREMKAADKNAGKWDSGEEKNARFIGYLTDSIIARILGYYGSQPSRRLDPEELRRVEHPAHGTNQRRPRLHHRRGKPVL